MTNINIMVVDNEELLVRSLVDLLETQGYNIDSFLSAEDALKVLKSGGKKFDIVLTDINMPNMDGYRFIEEIKETIIQDIKIIVLTGFGSIESAVRAIKLGADSYCQKDNDPELLLFEVKKIAEHIKLNRDYKNLQKESEKNSFYFFDSNDLETKRIFEMAKHVASKDVNILITGESGTGKEILSRFIYNNSGVKGRFVSVNCSAIPDSLFESVMFGHSKGAFTGAHEKTLGFFQQAENGILMLDEIGELPPMNQVKLLKVIEEKIYYPVGLSVGQNANCRIISATNQDLLKKIENDSFRMDFYYRINTVMLTLPPLRHRKKDIPELTDMFVKYFTKKYQNNVTNVSIDAINVLLSYAWPGNIRQLRQTIERSVLFCSGNIITAEMIKQNITQNNSDILCEIRKDLKCPYRDAKTIFEKKYFTDILEIVDGNINEAAIITGMNRTYLYKKIKELELEIYMK